MMRTQPSCSLQQQELEATRVVLQKQSEAYEVLRHHYNVTLSKLAEFQSPPPAQVAESGEYQLQAQIRESLKVKIAEGEVAVAVARRTGRGVVAALSSLPRSVLGLVNTLNLAELGLSPDDGVRLSVLLLDSGGLAHCTCLRLGRRGLDVHRSLQCCGNSLGNKGVSAISCALRVVMPRLTSLELSGNCLGEAGACSLAAVLAKLPELRSLDLSENPLGDAGLGVIAAALRFVPKLTSISLRCTTGVTTEGAIAISQALVALRHLHSLDLSENELGSLDESGLHPHLRLLTQAISSMPLLETLKLQRNFIDETSSSHLVSALVNTQKLRFFDYSRNSLGDAGATSLAVVLGSLPLLDTLLLSHNSIGVAGAVAIANAVVSCEHLKSLSMSSNPVLDSGALALSNAICTLRALEEVDLSALVVGDLGVSSLLSSLSQLSNISSLCVSHNALNHSVADLTKVVSANRFLTSLDISSTQIGDEGFAMLAAALPECKVNTLNASACLIGDVGLRALVKVISSIPQLASLSLAGNAFSDETASLLFDSFHGSPRLVSLDFSDCSLTANSVTALARSAAFLQRLASLNLSHNCLQDAGAAVLFPSLRFLPTLSTLILRGTSIGESGAQAFAESLCCVPDLTAIDLSDCCILDSGVAAIAAALGSVPRLVSLKLARVGITSSGAASLASAVRCVPQLMCLVLDGNNIGEYGSAVLTQALRYLPQLTALDVDRDSIMDCDSLTLLAEDTPGLMFSFGSV